MLNLEDLSSDDLAVLRLSSQVLAHKAALAGLPRVEMFFERLETEAVTEAAARGQRGARPDSATNPWLVGGMSTSDRESIADYLELLANNAALPATVRDFVRRLIAAQRLS